jgi:hypothetical protein
MFHPSKADCITILSAASHVTPSGALLKLDCQRLGLSCNGLETAASFLIERDCFTKYSNGDGQIAVGCLSLQGRLRLDQLANG